MPYITSAQVSFVCLLCSFEMCMSLPIILSVSQPSCYPSAHFLWKDDWLGFLKSGEDRRFTVGALFRGTYILALEAVNKCKSREETRERKIGEDKDFALKRGEFCIPLAPSSKTSHLRKYCYTAGASSGVTYRPLSPLMNGFGSFPISNS